MEPLAKNEEIEYEKRQNIVKLMLLPAWDLLKEMVNSVQELEESVEEAIRETIKENPQDSKELEKFIPINEISQKVLEEKVKAQFDTSRTFGIELNGKDKDGYNEIEDKVTNRVKAEVSEEKAIKNSVKPREKAGKQKNRVDED